MNHAITVEQAKLLVREGEGLSVEQTRQNTAMIDGVETRVIAGVKTGVKLVEMIRANPSMTRKEMASGLGLTIKGVDGQITRLKADGILRRVGPDRGGHWEIESNSGKGRP